MVVYGIMKNKILSFIYDGKKFLALHSKPHPDHGEGGWFVVTGGVEEKESFEEAVKREVKEETNLDSTELVDLNWKSIYEWWGEICNEKNFLAFVIPEKIVLNEEHDHYEWLDLDRLVDTIKWDDDKKVLKEVLKEAINRERFFKKEEVKDYRRS